MLASDDPRVVPRLSSATDVARRWLRHFERHEFDSLRRLYAPRAVLHDEHGRANAPAEIMARLKELRSRGCTAADEVLIDHAIVRVSWQTQTDGVRVHSNLRVDDGRITEQWISEGLLY